MEPIEFAGEVSAEDWRRARLSLHQRRIAILWAGPIVILLLGAFSLARRGEVRLFDVLAMAFWIAMLAADPLIDSIAFHSLIRERSGLTTFRFEPFQFHGHSPCLRESARWSQLERVIETKEYFILASGPWFAWVIPRRLMGAETEADWRELATSELDSVGKRIEVRP